MFLNGFPTALISYYWILAWSIFLIMLVSWIPSSRLRDVSSWWSRLPIIRHLRLPIIRHLRLPIIRHLRERWVKNSAPICLVVATLFSGSYASFFIVLDIVALSVYLRSRRASSNQALEEKRRGSIRVERIMLVVFYWVSVVVIYNFIQFYNS